MKRKTNLTLLLTLLLSPPIFSQAVSLDTSNRGVVEQAPTVNPDGTGLVHYKQEYEKAKIRLENLKKQAEQANKDLAAQDATILELSEQIKKGKTTLLALKTDLTAGQSGHEKLAKELLQANQALVARGENVVRLQLEVAQSLQMESDLQLDINSENSKLEKKSDQFDQVEATLAIPHVKGWHYTPDHGWLYAEAGTYPLIFAERSQSWMYYDQGTSEPWWYFDYNTESWQEWFAN